MAFWSHLPRLRFIVVYIVVVVIVALVVPSRYLSPFHACLSVDFPSLSLPLWILTIHLGRIVSVSLARAILDAEPVSDASRFLTSLFDFWR